MDEMYKGLQAAGFSVMNDKGHCTVCSRSNTAATALVECSDGSYVVFLQGLFMVQDPFTFETTAKVIDFLHEWRF